MTTAEQLRELTRMFQIHKRQDRNEILAALYVLIEIAERLEKLEDRMSGL